MKKTLVLLATMLLVITNLNINILADDSRELPETPQSTISLTGSRKTARYGDDITIKLDGLSFNNPIGIKNFKWDYYTEAIDTTQELQEIVIPRFDAKANGDEDGVLIRIMAIVQNGSSLRIVKDIVFLPDDGQESVVVTRAEILEWAEENNDGKLPNILYYNFGNTKDGVIDYDSSRVFYELKQSAPIEYRYKVVEGKPYKDATYQLYQGALSWYTTDPNKRTSVTKSVLPYYETSDIEVESNRYDDLKPGDLVELNITLVNNSTIANRFLWIGLEAKGLELVTNESNTRTDLELNASDWQVNGDHFYTPIYKDGAWPFINPTKEYTTTQVFRVMDDYDASTIEVMPYLFTNDAFSEREYNESIVLNIDVVTEEGEEVDGGTVLPPEENNGPNEPDTENPGEEVETPNTENPGEEVETPNTENPGEEVETPNTENPGEEVETPNTENPGEEVETPNTENPGEEVETPNTENPGEEVETPNTENPGEEVETPNTENPGEEVETPNTENPGEEVETPNTENPGEEVETPNTENPGNGNNGSVQDDRDQGDTGLSSGSESGNENDSNTSKDKDNAGTGNKQSGNSSDSSSKSETLPNTGINSSIVVYLGIILTGFCLILFGKKEARKDSK